MVEIEIEGIPEFEMNLERVQRGIDQGIKQALKLSGATVEAKAKKNASGRPGPNVRTGHLRRNITHQVEGSFVVIGTNVDYAKFVEFGTVRAPPYPFLRPALIQSKLQVERIFKNLLGKNIKLRIRE